jgi:hypothetical protein
MISNLYFVPILNYAEPSFGELCLAPRDVTTEILQYWKHTSTTLPPVAQLRQYLDTPLPEHAKIPILQYEFDNEVSRPSELYDRIGREDVQRLFRVDEEERASSLLTQCSAAISMQPPGKDGSENSFITFWDSNFRNFVDLLVPDGVSIRNSNRDTSTASFRPDFGFLYLNILPI